MEIKKIAAAEAMLKVIEEWGVKHIFGLPGGSFDSTMNALFERKNSIKYIQVRHEEVGALAAAGEAKVTGKIGVTFGSAGPGAVHLLNGLYDAQADSVPVLALVGQVATSRMNTNYFQEMNENPMFADVAVYNRTVMTAEQLPLVVDQAIRQAYQHKGVAVVTIPTDLGWIEIPDTYVSTANSYTPGVYPLPRQSDIDKALEILDKAKHPIVFFGQGARNASEELKAFSEFFKIPIMSSALGKGIVNDDFIGYMGHAGRVGTKTGVDLLKSADTILFIGSNDEFLQPFFEKDLKFIQVDINGAMIGNRHQVDLGILGDAKVVLQSLIDNGKAYEGDRPFYQAAVANKKNWWEWMSKFENLDEQPLRVETIFKRINDVVTDDAIFNLDVGNITIEGLRFIKMKETQDFTLSAWYATMGCAVPSAIGTKLTYPKRQVWSLSGDGGFTMVMQDISTQVKYKLPIINVVFSNNSLGFIEGEQDDTKQAHSGIDLLPIDFAKVAEAMGAKGYTVTSLQEMDAALKEATELDVPSVINVIISNDRPFTTEKMIIDAEIDGEDEVAKFNDIYYSEGLVPFRKYLEEYKA